MSRGRPASNHLLQNSHRIATIRKLDFIVVLGFGGVIIEQGNHDELFKKKGSYYELCRLNEGLDARPSLDSEMS